MTSKNSVTSTGRAGDSVEPAEFSAFDSYAIAYYRNRAERLRAAAIAEMAAKVKTGLSAAGRRFVSNLRSGSQWRLLSGLQIQSLRRKQNPEARAIAELSACSDKDLMDLGIARSTIAEVVRHGRSQDRLRSDAR